MDMLIATILAGFVFIEVWKWNWLKAGTFIAVFLTIDIVFFSANIIKVTDGGWFPLVVGLILILLMTTWKKGRGLLYLKLKDESMDITSFLLSIKGSLKSRVN